MWRGFQGFWGVVRQKRQQIKRVYRKKKNLRYIKYFSVYLDLLDLCRKVVLILWRPYGFWAVAATAKSFFCRKLSQINI